MKIFHLFLLLLVLPFTVFAQDVEMADMLRQSGKIYVVVAIIAVVFVGLAVYLLSIVHLKGTTPSGKTAR